MSSQPNQALSVIDAAWEKRSGPAVFCTVDGGANPNAIYVTCIRRHGANRFVIADNYFNKTRMNIARGCRGAVLFITEAGKSYQLKGSLSIHKAGEVFAFMKSWLDPKHPGVSAVVLEIEEAYCGGEKLI